MRIDKKTTARARWTDHLSGALGLLCCLGITSACGPAAGAVSVPTAAPATTAAARPRAYVWTMRAEDDSPVTNVLSENGDVVTTLPGVRIAAAGTLWTWEETTEDVPTTPCEDRGDRASGEGHGTRVRLVPSDGWHDPVAIVVPPPGDGADTIEHAARPLASVGPYLFVEESTDADTCGAHGNTAVSFAAWNIEEAKTVDLLSDVPHRNELVAAGKSEIDDDPDAADFSDDGDPAALTELLPRIGTRGQLEAMALVTVPSCYACTQGGWGSYTVSTPVVAELPRPLQAMSAIPHAVSVFADLHPELTIGGYSVEVP